MFVTFLKRAGDAGLAKALEMKRKMSFEELCLGQPCEFVTYLKYCRVCNFTPTCRGLNLRLFCALQSLHFEEKPDYAYLRKLFRDLVEKLGFKCAAPGRELWRGMTCHDIQV